MNTEGLAATASDLSGKTTIVVGASRGLGRGIAAAFAEAGAPVVAVSRTPAAFPGHASAEAATPAPRAIQAEVADAADATVPARILDRYQPANIVLVAGATPHMRPLPQHTWETFSANWNTDVRIAFHWLREALLTPLRPGGKMIVFSSGAALNPNGSPLSGGYAGAKATQRLIAAYAQDEADRAGLGITFTTALPRFAPATGVGRPAVQAYAARGGQPVEDYLQQMDYELLNPQIAGAAMVQLAQADAGALGPAYLLTGAGLEKLDL